jgi:hypothetical protein
MDYLQALPAAQRAAWSEFVLMYVSDMQSSSSAFDFVSLISGRLSSGSLSFGLGSDLLKKFH